MKLKRRELHFWRYCLDEKDYIAELNEPILSDEEKERYKRFINQSDKIRYICNHRFMRNVLSLYLNMEPNNIKFEYTVAGKIYVKQNIRFNLSYRGSYGLLAISKNKEVGVDIEKVRVIDDILSFTSLYFSEKEKAIIINGDKSGNLNNLFDFWTLKEALIKADGKGLSMNLNKINLADSFWANNFNLLSSIKVDNNLYTLKNIKVNDGYCAAFAMKGKVKKYLEFNYEGN